MAPPLTLRRSGSAPGFLQPRHRHRGEGLVDLDTGRCRRSTCRPWLQRALGGRDRGFEHDYRIAADYGQVVDASDRLDAERLQALGFADHHDTPEAPSQIWLELAAVSLPFFLQQLDALDAFHRWRRSGCLRRRCAALVLPSASVISIGDDLVLERARLGWRRWRFLVAAIGVFVQLIAWFRPYLAWRPSRLRHELAELDVRDSVLSGVGSSACRGRSGPAGSTGVTHRHAGHALDAGGDDDVLNVPLITAWAAKCSACCDEPHWRSTLVAGHAFGEGATSQHGAAGDVVATVRRPGMTQPMITSSTRAGSAPVRSIRLLSTSAREVGGVPAREFAALAATAGGAGGGDDIGFGHLADLRIGCPSMEPARESGFGSDRH